MAMWNFVDTAKLHNTCYKWVVDQTRRERVQLTIQSLLTKKPRKNTALTAL